MIPEMVKKIHKVVLDDCSLKVRELDVVGIAKSMVHCILSENLEMKGSFAPDGCCVSSHLNKTDL